MDLISKYKLDDPECKFRLNKVELVLSSLAINFLSLALPIMVLQVYDRIMANHSEGTLMVLAMGVCLAVTFETILRIIRSYATGWAGMLYEYSLSANALRYYINSDPSKIQNEGAGKQLQNLSAFSKLRDFYSGQVLVTLIDVPFAAVYLLLIFYITNALVIVPLVLIIFFAYFSCRMGNKLLDSLEKLDEIDDKKYNFIIESLQGIHSIKSYGIEATFKRRYEKIEEDAGIANYNTSLISSEIYSSAAFFNEIMVISIACFGAPMVIEGKITTGALIATVLLAGRFMQPLQKALFLWSQFQDYKLGNQKADYIYSLPQIERDAKLTNLKKIGKVELDNVSFGYNENLIFKEINLKFEIPDIISIHGPISSGKSTLLKLIAGIMKPTGGSIKIDDVEVSLLESQELVNHVGLIVAENIIFHGTIMQNLTAFDDSKEKQAIELAKLIHLDEEIALLPNGYETEISDGSADTIAPGVKQRISIVRVLINKPKVILFNNADKGLDKEGYNHLIRLLTLLKGKVAMIISTDDHNISKLANRHFVMTDKKLREVRYRNNNKK